MPTYGPYETTREIASGHGCLVYSARKAGEDKDGYVVKVFALESFVGDEARSELDPLLADFGVTFNLSVELQRRAAAASQHVAPILDVGQESGSAWYATRLYPRSVQKILEGRAALGVEWVHHIISSVARGALDFKRACGRPHGEIKPSNILISASQKVRDAAVVLSDPLPGDTSETARYEVADLHAIGQIIYQLVRRREIEDASATIILPIESSVEWTGLFGKDSSAWLSLCNRLLDPNLSLDQYNLERLEADLAKLQPKPPVTGKLLALAAVVAALLGVGVFYLVSTGGRGTLLVQSNLGGVKVELLNEAEVVIETRTTSEGAPLKLTLANGVYFVRGSYPGLAPPPTNRVEIKSRSTQKQSLDFQFATLSVQSTPSGATISVDGTNWLAGGRPAVTPYSVKPLNPGRVRVQLDLNDYETANLPERNVRAGETASLSTNLVKRQAGAVPVVINSNFRAVEIAVDGEPLGQTPFTKYLRPGPHYVVGRRKGWPDQRLDFSVQPNQGMSVTNRFPRVKVAFDSDPSPAKVYAEQRKGEEWETPFSEYWPTGKYAFRFEKAGYEVATVSTNIWQDDDEMTVRMPTPMLVKTNGVFMVSVEPVAATVIEISSQEKYPTSPGRPVEIERAAGRRPFRIEAPDYLPQTINFDFRPKTRSNLLVRLLPQPLPVLITSDPPGADLYDSSRTNRLGPVKAITNLAAGTYTLYAFHHGHRDLGWATNTLVVAKGGSNSFHFVFPYTHLTITSSPPQLKVYEVLESGRRGELIGITPTNRPYRRLGRLTLEFISWDGTNLQRPTFVLEKRDEQVGVYFRPPKPKPYVNSIGMVFEWILEQGTNGGFWVGKYEVTQPEYETLMARVSTHQYAGATNLPADSVSLTNALEFCRRLTDRERPVLDRTSVMDQPMSGWVYTLPSPSQWRYYRETNLANAVIRKERPESVEKLVPNEFDLCGVRGNLWEWCSDGVPRGAAYNSREGLLRHLDPDAVLRLSVNQPSSKDVGFRCVLIPPRAR